MFFYFRLLLILIVFSAGSPAWAQPSEAKRTVDHHAMAGSRSQAHSITLDAAVTHIRESIPGRVLSARSVGNEYRIRILTEDGRVQRLRIDPSTGKPLP